VPARNRQTNNDAKDFEKPAPSVKKAHKGNDTLYTTRLPCVSDMGEAIMGPNAKPKT
jgi:hypothetical protein